MGTLEAKGVGSRVDSSVEMFGLGTWELFREQLFYFLPAASQQSSGLRSWSPAKAPV